MGDYGSAFTMELIHGQPWSEQSAPDGQIDGITINGSNVYAGNEDWSGRVMVLGSDWRMIPKTYYLVDNDSECTYYDSKPEEDVEYSEEVMYTFTNGETTYNAIDHYSDLYSILKEEGTYVQNTDVVDTSRVYIAFY